MLYPNDNSQSAKLYGKARSLFPGGALRHPTFTQPYPVYAATARGCHITDVDGVERVDFVNNFSALIHGHAHPKLVEVACDQIGGVTGTTMATETAHWLAELLIDRVPGVEQVCFGNSGTEAVLFAVKAARAYTGRSKIAKIEGGYHGQYDLIQHSFTSTPANWGDEDNPNNVPLDEGTPQEVLDLVVTLSPNNVEASRTAIRRHADSLAAIIVDPVPQRLMGIPLSDEYLKMLREETSQHGIVLVFDEIISLRLGKHGTQGAVGITPDLTTMGKIIGGGYPIGALGGKREVMSVFDPSNGPQRVFHGGTYSANPVSTGVGFAAMQLLDDGAFEQLALQGNRLRAGLREAIRVSGFPAQANGQGSFTGVVLVEKPYSTYRDTVLAMGPDYMARARSFFLHMLNGGVLISPQCVFFGSTQMTDDDVDKTIEASFPAFRNLADEFS